MVNIEVNNKKETQSRLGYKSAIFEVKQGNYQYPTSGYFDAKFDRYKLVSTSRIFYKENPIYCGIVNKLVTYIVGDGAYVQAHTDDPEWNKLMEYYWTSNWEGTVDISDRLTGLDFEKMVVKETILAGDVGVILLKSNKLQIAESENIRKSNNVIDYGVDYDTNTGKITKYYVTPYQQDGVGFDSTHFSYSPNDFCLVGKLDRLSLMRAMPPLQSIFPMLDVINSAINSEVESLDLVSRLAISVTKQNPENIDENDALNQEDIEDGRKIEVSELGPIVFHGAQGDKIEGIARNMPNPNFIEAIKYFSRIVGLPMSIPLEMILLDWTNSNYSQSRAVIIQFKQAIQEWQSYFISAWYKKVYERFVDFCIKNNLIDDRPDKYNCSFHFQPMPLLDPQKETQAIVEKLSNGLCSYQDALQDMGKDPTTTILQIKNEIENACKIASEIKEKYGYDISPSIFCGLDNNSNISKINNNNTLQENIEE